MAKFEASEYSQFRGSYSKLLFKVLQSYCGPFSASRPLKVLDLGGGTGFSTSSFLEFYPWAEITLVEPDLEMLNAARSSIQKNPIRFVNSTAEAFEMTEVYDLVLIASAWHWMDRKLLQKKFEDSGLGAVFVFEYQFPKAIEHDALNEWVRRQFNVKWRTSNQVPRGTLVELTDGLRSSSFFSEINRVFTPNETLFSADSFFGMIISQSRFLAYEAALSSDQKTEYRKSVRDELQEFWGLHSEMRFSQPYEGVVFRRRLP